MTLTEGRHGRPAEAHWRGLSVSNFALGVVSEAQRVLHQRLALAGFPVAICHSVEEALDAVAAFGVPLRGRCAA
jgi:hypothetical protein